MLKLSGEAGPPIWPTHPVLKRFMDAEQRKHRRQFRNKAAEGKGVLARLQALSASAKESVKAAVPKTTAGKMLLALAIGGGAVAHVKAQNRLTEGSRKKTKRVVGEKTAAHSPELMGRLGKLLKALGKRVPKQKLKQLTSNELENLGKAVQKKNRDWAGIKTSSLTKQAGLPKFLMQRGLKGIAGRRIGENFGDTYAGYQHAIRNLGITGKRSTMAPRIKRYFAKVMLPALKKRRGSLTFAGTRKHPSQIARRPLGGLIAAEKQLQAQGIKLSSLSKLAELGRSSAVSTSYPVLMEKVSNISKVRQLLAQGLSLKEAISKAYPAWSDEQVAAMAAKLGGPAKTAGSKKKKKWEEKARSKAEKHKTYPISRFLTSPGGYGALTGAGQLSAGIPTAAAVGGMGALGTVLGRGVAARAARGRARLGQEGVFTSEKELLQALRNRGERLSAKDSRTFPISRFFSSLPAAAALGGVSGAGGSLATMLAANKHHGFKVLSKGQIAAIAALMGGAGAGTSAYATALYRAMGARAQKGRARRGVQSQWRTTRGLTESDRKVIKALAKAQRKNK